MKNQSSPCFFGPKRNGAAGRLALECFMTPTVSLWLISNSYISLTFGLRYAFYYFETNILYIHPMLKTRSKVIATWTERLSTYRMWTAWFLS